MKYYIIAGEASGDLHASNLVAELKKQDSEAKIRAWGGDLLEKQGVELAKNYNETAFMGFFEVLANLGTIKKLFTFCKQDILNFKPDIVIFVDYPGFNLRMAEFTKANNIRSYYYISPKIWAWKQKRAYKIKAFIDKMFVIFPFEIEFYKEFDYSVSYIGNPLIDEIEKQKKNMISSSDFKKLNLLDDRPIIALLAGSRKQEISHILPKMLKISSEFKDYQFVIAGAPGLEMSLYQEYILHSDVKLVYNQTYALLNNSKAAVVASGTATLETALFSVPQIVAYVANPLSFFIAKLLVKIKYISLVNIILDRQAVTELLQNDFTVEKTANLLHLLLEKSPERERMMKDYDDLKTLLGEKGASERAAIEIYHDLQMH